MRGLWFVSCGGLFTCLDLFIRGYTLGIDVGDIDGTF
jgi:hypothetical protein